MKLVFFIFAAVVVLSGGCSDKSAPQDLGNFVGDIVKDVNKDVVKDLGKEYPLPEQVVVSSAHNDKVNYTTTLALDKVVEFYRTEYPKRGATEMPEAASVGPDSANLAFRTSGKSVYIEMEKRDNGTKVHLEKK